MTKLTSRDFPIHPVYCSCCPDRPQVMAQKLGDHLLEIRSRKHGTEHVAVVLLDKNKTSVVPSEAEAETNS